VLMVCILAKGLGDSSITSIPRPFFLRDFTEASRHYWLISSGLSRQLLQWLMKRSVGTCGLLKLGRAN
jgi:hypothetical protein